MTQQLGEFVLRERLGEGGFATVWRADQPALGRDAVVKVLHARGQSERFLSEVRLAARLDHPYAAHVYAFGAEPDGRLWIAMERVRGTPLDELLLAAGPMSLERLVPLVDRLCEVVQTAHEQGIVHRDIKPANVMVLSRAGRLLPKLLDLGVAAPLGEATGDGARAGTPRYMAPEQWTAPASVDARVDIYALGVLIYECLTGRPPFDGASWYALAKAHARKPVPPLGPGFPPALDGVLARAMAKQPAGRYATAGELGAALRSASGVGETRAPLPQLPAALRDAWMAGAPQPLAEAVAALDAAGNAHQALAAARTLVSATARWLALVAMAAASRAGGRAPELARELRRRPFSDEEWLALARAQTEPAHGRPEAFPLPELARELPRPPSLDVRAPSEEELRLALHAPLAALGEWLAALDFLLAYPLVRARRGVAERWSGLRRAPRAAQPVAASLPEGEAALVDAEGSPVCILGPLVQIGAPAPGAAEEVFLLEGPGRHGARLTALPGGFERQDEAPWDFLRARLDAGSGAADAERAAGEERPPWPGLAAFTVEDSARYVGREREAQAFVNRLRVTPFLAVVGPSGAGKSSFVQAGVIPILPDGWRARVFRPGPAPDATLARAQADPGPSDVLVNVLVNVLVIDQLEELFTLGADREAQLRFAAALAAGERVVVTLRDDFLMRAEALPALREKLATGLVLLSTPAEEDLRRVVVEPARRAGYELDDPALPAEMAHAVADHPGALALLSFTASRLWERRDRHFRRLLRSVYDEMGGVGGALAAHAEETLASLRPDEQRLVREAFRRLVTPAGTRAVISRADLLHVVGAGAETVLERLVAARLLVVSEAEHGQERVEVVHEALLDAWPRLVAWRREDAVGARLRAQLEAAARQWDERGRARGLLWRDEALTELTGWRRAGGEALTPVEDAFAAASVDDAARGRRRRRAALAALFVGLAAGLIVLWQMNRRTEEQRRQAQARLAELHEEQGRQALLAGRPDHALVFLAEAEKLGRARASTRYLVGSALRGQSAQIAWLRGHAKAVVSLAFSPDGTRVVSGSDDGTARVWDAASGSTLATLRHEGPVWRVSFSPDGALLATASWDGTARLWRADGTLLHTFKHENRVYTAAFSPDGLRLATTSRDGSAVVWDVASGAELARHGGQGDVVRDAAWRPDGQELATVADSGVLRVFAADGRERLKISAHELPPLFSVAWSRDGRRLATAGADRTAAVWDAGDGSLVARLHHAGPVYAASFDAGGERVLTASGDSTAGIWLLQPGGDAVLTSLAHPAIVRAAAWSRDGTRVVTAAGDGSARVYTAAGVPVARLAGHADELRAAVFDATGERVATGVQDGSARVWRAQPAALVHDLDAPGHRPWSAFFLPGGDRLLTAGLDQTLRIWDATRAVELQRLSGEHLGNAAALDPAGTTVARACEEGIEIIPLDGSARQFQPRGHAGKVTALAFSPDGRRLITAGDDGVRVRAVAGGETRLFLGPPETTCAVFSPDGRTLATCGSDGNVRFRDADSGAQGGQIQAGGVPLAAIAFDHSGGRIIVAERGKLARVVARDGATLAVLQGHTTQIDALAFSGSGDLAATASFDGTVRIWDAETGKELEMFAQHGGRVTSVAFGPDDRRLLSSSFDASAKLWDISLDTRNPQDLQSFVRCNVPFRLQQGQPIPISLDSNLCSDSM